MQESKEERFLKERFKEYYQKKFIGFNEVSFIEKREFGIGKYMQKIYKRHMHFASYKELNRFLREETPLFISYSLAYYKEPFATPMESKGFEKADIVFEIDADMLNVRCLEKHFCYYCKNCKIAGFGLQQKCTNCYEKLERFEFYCENCLEEAKKELLKLLELLKKEFGIEEKDIAINFSGNAGYHLHIRKEFIWKLKQQARIDILDYITFENVDYELLGIDFKTFKIIGNAIENRKNPRQKKQIPNLLSKLLSESKIVIESLKEEELQQYLNIRKAKAESIINAKEKLARNLVEKGVLFESRELFGTKEKAKKFWQLVFNKAKERVKINVDRQTSVDIAKLIRVPNSLHGSTAMIAKTIENKRKLKYFKPFENAVFFRSKNNIKVNVLVAPRFCIGNDCYGPFENQEVSIDEKAAIMLVAKGVAKLV